MAEQSAHNRLVAGSNPAGGTNLNSIIGRSENTMGVCIKCGIEIDPHEEPEYNIWLTYRKDGHMAYSPKVIFSEYICSDCKGRLMDFLTKDGLEDE